MKKVVLVCLLLAGCNQSPDGYSFGPREWTRDKPQITVVEEQDVTALRADAKRRGVVIEEGRQLMAFSVIRGATCEMHVVRPERSYQPEWLGHEFAHCVWGRWHL